MIVWLHLYRKLLQLRQTVLTATGDTSADLLDMGDTVVAYSRPATEGRRFLSVTNFGDEPIALPDDAVAIANSVPLTDDGKLNLAVALLAEVAIVLRRPNRSQIALHI